MGRKLEVAPPCKTNHPKGPGAKDGNSSFSLSEHIFLGMNDLGVGRGGGQPVSSLHFSWHRTIGEKLLGNNRDYQGHSHCTLPFLV